MTRFCKHTLGFFPMKYARARHTMNTSRSLSRQELSELSCFAGFYTNVAALLFISGLYFVCSTFLSICRRRLLSLCLPPAIILGTVYGYSLVMAEYHYYESRVALERKDAAEAYLSLRTAYDLFPFAQRIRTGYLVIHTAVPGVPVRNALKASETVLENDPFGPVALYHSIIHNARQGNERALDLLQRMEKYFPDWPQTQTMREIIG